MKTLTISTSNVALEATNIMVKKNVDIATATAHGLALEVLKNRLLNGEILTIIYKKVDGTIRTAKACLKGDLAAIYTKGTGLPRRFFGQFAYIDLGVKGDGSTGLAWRSFRPENFIGIVED